MSPGASPHRAILHVDMDAFYASVEQRDDPSLAGKPLIVGGTSRRGVVAAASYEVRRFGVRSAMPIRRALELCPQAICVRPRMKVYQQVSRQVFAIFHDYTPLVQGLSLDEAFLDVTASERLKGDAVSIAREVKRRILETTSLTASVGVATNKLIAKIASNLGKPDALTVVPADRIHEVLDPLSVRRLPGLGRKTGEKVEAAGVKTFADLRRAPDGVLWPIFGRYTQRVRDRASGIDDRPVLADWEEKSVSAEDTFESDLSDRARMQAELARLADRTCSRLRAKHLVSACVTVKIRRSDFTTYSRQRRVAPPTSDTRVVASIAAELLDGWLAEQPRARVRLLGVGVTELAPANQLDLFRPAREPEASRLDGTIDRIRERFGMQSLTRASGIKTS